MTVDPARLARALHLHATEVENGTWHVTGGSEPHWVQHGTCDCFDCRHRGNTCKHMLAVHMTSALHPDVLDALRTLHLEPAR